MYWNGIIWRPMESHSIVDLTGVHCRPDGQTVIVGVGGLALNHSGEIGEDSPWLAQDSRSPFSLYDVRDDGEGRTYAVGYNGIVVQYDGSEWSILTSGYHDRLNAVDIDPCGNIIMAGHWGIILRNGY